MSTRKIKNAVNNTTGELIYFKGHAQATYMSDGSTVEDAIKNIKPDLSDYVKSEELEGYAKTSDIPSLEGYAKEEDIPSLDGYAKTEDIPSLDGYVQSSELPNFDEFAKTNDIPSTEGLATEDFVTSQGYLTEIPDEYITNTELNSKGYATKTELNSLDFDHINNTPFTNDENGELNIVDEQGNVGLKLDGECLYVKDVVAGEHTLSNKADTSYVDEEIAKIVDGAPETLDTLNELSAALKDNADIVDVLNQSISSKQDTITDLETIRQGAAKGATALQSYTEQYKGTVTGVKINGTTKNPSNGVVDLGTVITAHQTLKTINGQSIVGSGDITISGGGSSGGSGAYAEVNHGTSDTTFTLTPNTFHVWGEVASLTLTLGNETTGVANEYLFQFTSGATATSLTLPDNIKWVNDTAPTIAENMIYQVSILKGLASVLEFSNVQLISFILSGATYTALQGMTWVDWCNSSYNSKGAHVNGNFIYAGAGVIMYNNATVLPSDVIIDNRQYIIAV